MVIKDNDYEYNYGLTNMLPKIIFICRVFNILKS